MDRAWIKNRYRFDIYIYILGMYVHATGAVHISLLFVFVVYVVTRLLCVSCVKNSINY